MWVIYTGKLFFITAVCCDLPLIPSPRIRILKKTACKTLFLQKDLSVIGSFETAAKEGYVSKGQWGTDFISVHTCITQTKIMSICIRENLKQNVYFLLGIYTVYDDLETN